LKQRPPPRRRPEFVLALTRVSPLCGDALPTRSAICSISIVDDTGFLKQGSESVGVQRQYTGSAGRITNCQIGVSLAIATGTEHVALDFELYLPKNSAEDDERREQARIPAAVKFKTKILLALDIVERAALSYVLGEIISPTLPTARRASSEIPFACVATGHNLIHLQRFHRGPLTRPVVLLDTSPLGSRDVDAAVRGASAARAVPGQPVPRQKVGEPGVRIQLDGSKDSDPPK
jgi:hypothetical protein